MELYNSEEQEIRYLVTEPLSDDNCWIQTINDLDNNPYIFDRYSKLKTYLRNQVIKWLQKNNNKNYKELKKQILNLITEPFLTEPKLAGEQADSFFDDEELVKWRLTLEKINENYALVADTVI